MAKEIEIAFSSIYNHKNFKLLRALELGIFLRLTQAYFLDGFNYKTARPTDIQSLTNCTALQWYKVGNKALDACEALIPILEQQYQTAMDKRRNLSIRGKQAFAKTERAKRLAQQTHDNLKDGTNHFLTEQSAQPVILQPSKAPRHRPENSDIASHLKIKNAPKSANRLIDKG